MRGTASSPPPVEGSPPDVSRLAAAVPGDVAGGVLHEQVEIVWMIVRPGIKTVQNYHYLIRTKTGMRTDAQLVRLAVECGLASL